MEGYVTFSHLNKVTEFLDNFCGTIEPSTRNAYFFYDNGLKIYASDNCGSMVMNFTRDFLPFEGVAIIPIQYLKGLTRGKNKKSEEIVKIAINKDHVLFTFEEMNLSTEIKKESSIPSIIKEFDSLSIDSLNDLIKKIDFVSASANEDDLINIFTRSKMIKFSYVSDYYYIESEFSESKKDFSLSIPYVTIRHVVKSLKKLRKDSKISIGVKKNKLVLLAPGVIINLCTQKYYNDVLKLETFKIIEELRIKSDQIKKALDKMYISFKKNNVAFIVLSTNGSYIYKEENDSHLSWKLDIKTEHKYLVQIHIRKLRSILTRMPENLLFKITESKLIISDLKSKKLAIFQIQKISK